ncbi:CCA tRNA nucleotidyltransferase [Lacticaseibacillus saniviri]
MQLDLSHPEFQAAIPIMQQIEAAGFEAYFVGGSVRDALLGLPIHDVDIASSAYPEEIKQIFKKTVDTGIQHGTVMVLHGGEGYEVTTFRTESGYQDFRRPDKVTFVRSLEEDLKRRDFTVNALAVKHDGTIVDLFGGLDDLDAKLLRAVGEATDRFSEDALRMMRAVRFQSQLGFAIEASTKQALQTEAPLLAHISIERIASEFTRLMTGIDRDAALTTMLDSGLSVYCPGFENHTDELRELTKLKDDQLPSAAVAWTLVVHALQVPATPLLKQWKQANALIETVNRANTLIDAKQVSVWQLYQAGEEAVTVASQAAEWLNLPNQWRAQYQQLPIKSKQALAINGQKLIQAGVKPGPQLGQLLTQVERAVVSGDLSNEPDVLLNHALSESQHN